MRNEVLRRCANDHAHHRSMTVKIALVVALAACVPPATAQPPNVYVSSEAHASIDTSDMGPIPCADCAAVPAMTPRARSVQVLVDKRIPRPTEVIAVFDFHSRADSEDKGFDELRARAAEIGADAVIGAEFEHGEGEEPSHLSGMAVRFLDY
jgi:hypothetical protein